MSQLAYSKLTDDQVMKMTVVHEDMDAFAEIVRRYKDRLLTYVTRYLGDRDRAEDIVQETFLRVFKARHRYDDKAGARFSTWIYTICTNLVRSEGRRAFWRRRTEISESEEGNAEDPTEHIVAREFRTAIEQAVEELKPHERLVFVLRDVDGLSYDEIAEIAKVPLGTVKSRVNRARHAFRAAYLRLHGAPEIG